MCHMGLTFSSSADFWAYRKKDSRLLFSLGVNSECIKYVFIQKDVQAGIAETDVSGDTVGGQ